MVAYMSDTVVIILVAAGCTKSCEEAHLAFTRKFGERISNIVKMALNKAISEEVTSADLWPTNVTPGDMFDGATLDNFETYGEDQEGKTILCTVALGLQRSGQVVQGDVVEFKTTTLLNPKVAYQLLSVVVRTRNAGLSLSLCRDIIDKCSYRRHCHRCRYRPTGTSPLRTTPANGSRSRFC